MGRRSCVTFDYGTLYAAARRADLIVAVDGSHRSSGHGGWAVVDSKRACFGEMMTSTGNQDTERTAFVQGLQHLSAHAARRPKGSFLLVSDSLSLVNKFSTHDPGSVLTALRPRKGWGSSEDVERVTRLVGGLVHVDLTVLHVLAHQPFQDKDYRDPFFLNHRADQHAGMLSHHGQVNTFRGL